MMGWKSLVFLLLLGSLLVVPSVHGWKYGDFLAPSSWMVPSSKATDLTVRNKNQNYEIVRVVKQHTPSDPGIWTAVVFVAAEILCRRPGKTGKVAQKVTNAAHQMVKFPGVAITLAYLYQPARELGSCKFFETVFKSFAVYLLRYFYLGASEENENRPGFVIYAAEGAIGITAFVKLFLQTWFWMMKR